MKRIVGMLVAVVILAALFTVPLPRATADEATTTITVRLAACADLADNDGDGLIDYPADPDCSSALDDDEAGSTPVTAQCADLADNDGDGLIDYPADPGCVDASDDDERNTVTIIVPGGGPPTIIILPALPQEPLPTKILRVCDFNTDNRCNIVDLSILLFYMHKLVAKDSPYDLNGDGVVDIVDISILFYYWA